MTLKAVTFALFAIFALAIAACGDDDDSGNGSVFELPPASDYKFNDLTGTMEVEFPAEGVSAAMAGLPQTETGNISGGLTTVLEGNVLTIQFLNLSVTFADTTIAFRGTGEAPDGTSDSTGTVGPDGTTLELHTEATTLDRETATSDGPIQLETDVLFPRPPLNLTSPDGWGPLPFVDGNGNEVFTITNVSLDLTLAEAPPTVESDDPNDGEATRDKPTVEEPSDGQAKDSETTDGESTNAESADGEAADGEEEDGLPADAIALPDPEGDPTACDTADAADDPAVDILTVDVIPAPDGVEVAVRFGQPPTETFGDFSFTVVVLLDSFAFRIAAIAQLHDGEEQVGLLGPDGSVKPGTEKTVRLVPEGLFFSFPETPGPGDVVDVQSFHIITKGGTRTCDVLSLALQ